MLFAQVKATHARFNFDDVVCLGSLEMYRLKGYKYLTAFAKLMAKLVSYGTSIALISILSIIDLINTST
jgi:hypothetical protein